MALSMLERLAAKGFPQEADHIREGLKKSTWPGRMQIIRKNPTILLDGAHNAGSMRALAKTILRDFSYEKMILVIGIMADKDIPTLLRAIVPMRRSGALHETGLFKSGRPACPDGKSRISEHTR